MFTSLIIVSCGQQEDRHISTQSSSVDDVGLELTPTEGIIISVATFTPTASPTMTPPLSAPSISGTEPVIILVPTPTISHTKQPRYMVTYTPEPTYTPHDQTAQPVVPTTAASRNSVIWSLTDTLDNVVYAAREDGNLEIFTAWVGHGESTQLTNDPGEDTYPALSPDGKMVAFASDRSGNFDIFLVDFRGGDLHRLTYDSADDTQPAWSPDGSQIVFVSKRDGNNELYIIDAACAFQDNGCPDDLYRMTRSVYDDLAPDWSPDGQRIAFMTGRDGNLEIYHAKTDGLDIVRLTDNPGVDGFPTWSPDSTTIAFHSEREGNFDIYARTLDGNQEWRLTTTEGEDRAPDWFGDNILYMSSDGRRFRIFLIQAPGISPRIEPQRVWSTSSTSFVGFPSWGRFKGTSEP
jgi:Tol biopolymer transport system component